MSQPRRRATDTDPAAARAWLAVRYDSPWSRLARLARFLAGRTDTGTLGGWLARRDAAWLDRYAGAGTLPPARYRRGQHTGT